MSEDNEMSDSNLCHQCQKASKFKSSTQCSSHHNTMFDQFCSQTRPFHRPHVSAHSPKFLIVSVLDTTSLACTDMCNKYILFYVLKGDGGGGGGGGGYQTHMQKSVVTSKSGGIKKTSCSMCVRGSVEYTKPILTEKN